MLTELASAAGLIAYAGYATKAPRSQLYGRAFVGTGRNSRLIALTYDDGPHPKNTPALLDVLSRNSVPATFFFIGSCVKRSPELAREVARAGHAIGNHTYSHPRLVACKPSSVRLELTMCSQILQETVGEHSRLWRPPYGLRLPHVMIVAKQLGLAAIMWTVSAKDWVPQTSQEIEARVLQRVKGGEVILMHDGGGDRQHTVEATSRLIPRLKGEGYRFLTVPEMMATQRDIRSAH